MPDPRQGTSVLGRRPSDLELGDITECRSKRVRKQASGAAFTPGFGGGQGASTARVRVASVSKGDRADESQYLLLIPQGLELLRWADTTFPVALEAEVEEAQHRLSHLSLPVPDTVAPGRVNSGAQPQAATAHEASGGQGRKRGLEGVAGDAQGPRSPARDSNARVQLLPPPHLLLASYPVLDCGPTPAYHSMAIVPFTPSKVRGCAEGAVVRCSQTTIMPS